MFHLTSLHINVGRLPAIVFGAGSREQLPALARQFGQRVLLVTGARSFATGPFAAPLHQAFNAAGLHYRRLPVDGEPSPQMIDHAVAQFRGEVDLVLGIGGGSVLDAAKAIAGLLPHGNSVIDHLEGVGPEIPYRGPALPFIAVPTTAGTGSEATKNAVLSVQGTHGFKKSFRDDALVARYAVVDPDLLETCSPPLIAANGMDALTQLIESYVSIKANPLTDALALSGLTAAAQGLLPWFERRGDQAAARAAMAYAALISGITLAQVGLGSVHGLASPLGAFFPIPHGVVCGTLVAKATAVNLAALTARAPHHPALEKYAHLAQILSGKDFSSIAAAQFHLVQLLEDWTARLQLPRLGPYGVTAADIERIVAGARGSSMKTNPIVLTDAEIGEVIRERL